MLERVASPRADKITLLALDFLQSPRTPDRRQLDSIQHDCNVSLASKTRPEPGWWAFLYFFSVKRNMRYWVGLKWMKTVRPGRARSVQTRSLRQVRSQQVSCAPATRCRIQQLCPRASSSGIQGISSHSLSQPPSLLITKRTKSRSHPEDLPRVVHRCRITWTFP